MLYGGSPTIAYKEALESEKSIINIIIVVGIVVQDIRPLMNTQHHSSPIFLSFSFFISTFSPVSF